MLRPRWATDRPARAAALPHPPSRSRIEAKRLRLATGSRPQGPQHPMPGPLQPQSHETVSVSPQGAPETGTLSQRGAQAPLLIVATTRPEFRPPWAMRSHHGVVSLAPLDRAQVRRMVGEIASQHALSDEMIDGVGERTGGVPLFVEEVTRLLLERDAQGGAQAIPPTLQQSLAARLDRLGRRAKSRRSARCLDAICLPAARDVSSTAPEFDELRSRPHWIGSRTPTSCLSTAPLRRQLSLQARADPGRGLRQPAQEPPPGAAPTRRRTPAGGSRARGGRARGHRPSFHRSRPRRSRDRMVGQGGRPGFAPLGLPGGDRPSRQGDRDGGRGGRDGAASSSAARPLQVSD